MGNKSRGTVACILLMWMGLYITALAQPSLTHDLSLRTSAWLRDLERQQGHDVCAIYADKEAPGAYTMDIQDDSLPELPGLHLFRVRLDPNSYQLDSGDFLTMVCKNSDPLPEIQLIAAYDAEGHLRVLSGALSPDPAYTWAPARLSLHDQAHIRLAYLQSRHVKTRRCDAQECVFRAYSELLGCRVEIRFAGEDADRFEIDRLGWRRTSLTRMPLAEPAKARQ
jgi:hypothetical protein